MANDLLISYIENLEQLRRDNRERLHNAALHWNKLANGTTANLSKLLITAVSIVLPLSLLPLTNSSVVSAMTDFQKWLLIACWVLLVLSLALGAIYIYQQSVFFVNWSRQENSRSAQFSSSLFSTDVQKSFDRLEVMQEKSILLLGMPDVMNNTLLALQALLAFIGVAILISVFGRLLFSM